MSRTLRKEAETGVKDFLNEREIDQSPINVSYLAYEMETLETLIRNGQIDAYDCGKLARLMNTEMPLCQCNALDVACDPTKALEISQKMGDLYKSHILTNYKDGNGALYVNEMRTL